MHSDGELTTFRQNFDKKLPNFFRAFQIKFPEISITIKNAFFLLTRCLMQFCDHLNKRHDFRVSTKWRKIHEEKKSFSTSWKN